jgi:hypothetical protein
MPTSLRAPALKLRRRRTAKASGDKPQAGCFSYSSLIIHCSSFSLLSVYCLLLLITDHSLLTLLTASHPIPDSFINLLRHLLVEVHIQDSLLIFRIA